MHIVAVANNKTDEEIMTKYNEGVIPALNFTDEQLKVIEVDLVKHHSPEKAPHAMTILRGFQIRGSRRELESFEVSNEIWKHIWTCFSHFKFVTLDYILDGGGKSW